MFHFRGTLIPGHTHYLPAGNGAVRPQCDTVCIPCLMLMNVPEGRRDLAVIIVNSSRQRTAGEQPYAMDNRDRLSVRSRWYGRLGRSDAAKGFDCTSGNAMQGCDMTRPRWL